MLSLYHTVIADPLVNVLVFLYNTIAFHDLGIAIIVLTILIRLALYPLFQKGLRYQTAMQELQPKLKKIQEEHKGNYEKQSQAMIELYREHNVNPFSGIIILIIQIPILIALYHVFLNIFKPEAFNVLYNFISRPEVLNTTFIGFINLGEHYIPLTILTAVAQYLQTYIGIRAMQAQGADKTQLMSMKFMGFIAPILTLIIFYRLPSAIALYWFTTSLISIGQQYMINRQRTNAAR